MVYHETEEKLRISVITYQYKVQIYVRVSNYRTDSLTGRKSLWSKITLPCPFIKTKAFSGKWELGQNVIVFTPEKKHFMHMD